MSAPHEFADLIGLTPLDLYYLLHPEIAARNERHLDELCQRYGRPWLTVGEILSNSLPPAPGELEAAQAEYAAFEEAMASGKPGFAMIRRRSR
jgi:hypothetical protein